jgi:hypothetical protein
MLGLLLPAQQIAFEHVLEAKSGQHMHDFTAVVHIMGDDMGDRATVAFGSGWVIQDIDIGGIPALLVADPARQRCKIIVGTLPSRDQVIGRD